MTNLTEEQIKEDAEKFEASKRLSITIVADLESLDVDHGVAVLAMGIAFSTGAVNLGMPLPVAIDVVRAIYAHAKTLQKAH